MKRAFRFGWGRANVEREVDDELEFHLAQRTQQLMNRGMGADEARQEALRQFGDFAQVRATLVTTDRERERTMRRMTILDELRQDLLQAARQLRHHAGFSLTVITMLALGIGANTTIFTLVDAVLLRNLPVHDPRALVVVGDPSRTTSFSFSDAPQASQHSYPMYQALRRESPLVTGLLATGRADRLDLRVDGSTVDTDRPRGRFVSGNYFDVLGVRAAYGRTFTASADEAEGGAPMVVISHDYWVRRFDSDPRVVGREITVNNARVTIVGIADKSFNGEIVGSPTDMWIPLTMRDVLYPNERVLKENHAYWLLLIGRLRPGTSLATAQSGFATLVQRELEQEFGAMYAERIRTMAIPVSSAARGVSRVRSTYGAPLLTLMTGVALLLLIVCANVGNLLLSRSVARAREMTVRVAIGAGRGRLVRQLLAESLLLAAIGAAAGLALAWYGSRFLLILAGSGGRALSLDLRLDLPVLAFTAIATVVAVVLFGLVPAVNASRVDLASAMRAHARSVTGGVGRGGRGAWSMGRLLISGQVALSLVLLVSASLLVRSLSSLEHTETGLDRDHLLVIEVDKIGRGLKGERTASYLREVTERLARLPEVTGVSYSMNGIFSGMEGAFAVNVPGFVARVADDSIVNYENISAGYVKAIGGRVVQGREFTPAEITGGGRVAMLNQTMARFYFGDRSPIDQFVRVDDSLAFRVVGVLADVRDHSLDRAQERRFYLPYRTDSITEPEALRFQLRTSGDPSLLRSRVREELRAVDPLMVVEQVESLSYLMQQSIAEDRLLARLATGFGFLALLLAAFGLYGVLTYAVSRRTGEIGLRMALGAQRGGVIGLVLGDALLLVGIGVVVGAPLSLAGGRLLGSQLHGIGAIDPVSIGVALFALTLAAAAAAMLPAWRASRVSPLTALRED